MLKQTLSIFRAFSDPARVRVLMVLSDQELCLCNLQVILDLSPSTVSRHVSILREAGLVASRKQGKWTYFSLVPLKMGSHRSELLRSLQDSLADDISIKRDREKAKQLKQIEIERCE
jgi:ArsR family transcriptional regulator